jgi:hypothetical protein
LAVLVPVAGDRVNRDSVVDPGLPGEQGLVVDPSHRDIDPFVAREINGEDLTISRPHRAVPSPFEAIGRLAAAHEVQNMTAAVPVERRWFNKRTASRAERNGSWFCGTDAV